jgi:hypothetical protein
MLQPKTNIYIYIYIYILHLSPCITVSLHINFMDFHGMWASTNGFSSIQCYSHVGWSNSLWSNVTLMLDGVALFYWTLEQCKTMENQVEHRINQHHCQFFVYFSCMLLWSVLHLFLFLSHLPHLLTRHNIIWWRNNLLFPLQTKIKKSSTFTFHQPCKKNEGSKHFFQNFK